MEKTIKQITVFKEEMTKIFVNSKNTVAMRNRNKFRCHCMSASDSIFIAAGRTEAVVASER